VELALLKIVIAAATVVGLAEIAKRINPMLSGVLLGLPLGAGLSVYFVAAEQGVDFVVPGLPWAIAGLCSAVVFCTVYLAVGQRLKCGRLLEVSGCSVVAMAAFFASAALVRSLEWTVLGATVAFLVVAAANIYLLRLLSLPRTVTAGKASGFGGLLLRGLIAGTIITAVTLVAPLAGSQWSGILSSFPSTLYALLIIVHYETGQTVYPGIIHSFARSVPALAVFYLGCMTLLPTLGLNRGFLAVYGISAAYVYLTHIMLKRK
jgi:hypothetical protein